MADVRIVVQDAAVRRMLERGRRGVMRALRAGTEDAMAYYLRQLRDYPPQRSGSTYRRTRTLSRSWSKRIISATPTSVTGRVGSNRNIAPYNRLVQDITRQARVHRGRWPTVQNIARRSRRDVEAMYAARLRQYVD